MSVRLPDKPAQGDVTSRTEIPNQAVQRSPRVSVVTPFYNNAEFIEQCMRSVLSQTFDDFEYIVVDNHSTDGGGEIAWQIAESDRRVRFYRPETFLAQAPNFNFALSGISGTSEYTKVIMADDLMFPRCLEEMVAAGDAFPSAGMIAAHRLEGNEVVPAGFPPSGNNPPSGPTLLSGRDAVRLYLMHGHFLFGTPSTVMYRSDLVRGEPVFYPPERIYQDTDAALRILRDVDFVFIHQILTYSRTQDTGLTQKQEPFRSRQLDRYTHIREFGAAYLNADELARQTECARREFRIGLAKQWLYERVGGTNPRYWEFQNRGLATVGERVRTVDILMGIPGAVWQAVERPFETLRFAARRSVGS